MYEIGSASDYLDLLEKLNTFLTTNGSAYGLTYAGTGTGTLTAYRGGASSVAETFTITATSSTNFTVVGSVSGSIGPATVGTPFSHAKIAFTLTAGGTAFVSGDVFTLTTAPKWTNMRRARGCTVTASSGTTGQYAAENVIQGLEVWDNNRYWDSGVAAPQTLECTYLDAQTIVEYAIMGNSSFAPKTWTLEYWNGSTWVTADTRTNITSWPSTADWLTFTVAAPASSTRWRLNITAGMSGSRIYIHQIEMRITAGGYNVAFGQYVWKAPGNDGTSEIYVGAHHFRRVDADYFNWELAGFDGYNAASEWYAQPNRQSGLYLPLVNSSIPYWFICNGRRVIVIAKVGSQYETAYMGLIDPYFTPGQLPYPLALGGSLAFTSPPLWNSTTWKYTNASNNHRAPTHSDPGSAFGSGGSVLVSHLRLRKSDGSWAGFFASRNDDFLNAPSDEHWIWPYEGDFNLLDTDLDGGTARFPVVLMHNAPNVYGQLDGISAISGQGLTAESLLTTGPVSHLVVLNINRTDRNDFLAVGLD